METDHVKSTKIFNTSPIFPKHEMETFMEECYKNIRKYLEEGAERDRYDSIQKFIAQGQDKYEAVCNGYLYIILTNSECAAKFFHEVVLFARDKLACIISRITGLIIDFIEYLTETARTQIFWLTSQLISLNASGVEGVVVALIRQIPQGNLPAFHFYMAEHVLKLLTENREWLVHNPTVLCISLYAFLRLIEDHNHPELAQFQQLEVEFCVSLMEQHFTLCLNMGRDFVRALQLVGRHPQIAAIINLINESPKSLSPNLKDVSQLFQKRTPKSIILSRISFDIENKLLFYTTHVPFKKYQRYQEWLYNQHFQTIASQSLLSDVIRYICCVIHPSNEILASSIVPRWALLNFLLFIAQKDSTKSNCKLAIYYDWFFCARETDPNVMNLECGLLLLFQLNRTHPAITASLLEFLCMMCHQKSLQSQIDCKDSISSSLRLLLEKKVVTTLAPLLQCQALEEGFVKKFKELFGEFFIDSNPTLSNGVEPEFIEYLADQRKNSNIPEEKVEDTETANIKMPNANTIPEEKAEAANLSITEETNFKIPKIVDLKSLSEFQELESEGIKEAFNSLDYTKNIKLRIDAAEAITNTLACLINVSHETVQKVAICFSHSFTQDMALPCMCFISNDSIEFKLSTSSPIFAIFRSLHYKGADSMCSPILSLLKHWYTLDSRLGYHLLFYMIRESSSKILGYSSLLTAFNFLPAKSFLISDLIAAFHLDLPLLRYIIIDVVNHFHADLINESLFLKLLVDCVSPFELNLILNRIQLGKISLFSDFSNPSLLKTEADDLAHFSKSSLWRLFVAGNPPAAVVMNIISDMNLRENSEELFILFTYIKSKKPSAVIVDSLLRLLPDDHALTGLPDIELAFDSIVEIFLHWISKNGSFKSLLTSISLSLNSYINDPTLCLKYLALMKSLNDQKSSNKKSSECISNFLNHETIRQSIQKMYKKFSANPIIQPKFLGIFDPFPMSRKIPAENEVQYLGTAHSKQYIDR